MADIENQARINTDLSSDKIQNIAPRIAVLGIGAVEQHSFHLPVSTDFIIASEVSTRVAETIGALCLPPLPYSDSLLHRGFTGTVYLRPLTLRSVLYDLGESLSEWNIQSLAILNCHGGNFILNPAIREWNLDQRMPHLFHIEVFNAFADTAGPNIHACEIETSLMLYLRPKLVDLSRAKDFVPSYPRSDLTHFGMKWVSPEGVWGLPTKGSAEKGEHYLKALVEYSIDRIRFLDKEFERR
ncbi:MAG TPA: creatininase family protein [Spirochaetales bacterium]|nr:creatininase family protein [Spirochaetales bacterium]